MLAAIIVPDNPVAKSDGQCVDCCGKAGGYGQMRRARADSGYGAGCWSTCDSSLGTPSYQGKTQKSDDNKTGHQHPLSGDAARAGSQPCSTEAHHNHKSEDTAKGEITASILETGTRIIPKQ